MSPQIGARLSWNEERRALGGGRALGVMSQFQPPSGQCARRRTSTRRRTSFFLDIPKRQQTASAFPSIDAWRRSFPATTRGTDGAAIQSSTVFAAARALASVAGTPSSTSETSLQWAPVHLL